MTLTASVESVSELPFANDLRRAGFFQVTEHRPGEKCDGKPTWISVAQIAQLRELPGFGIDRPMHTRILLAGGGFDNYRFVDVREQPSTVVMLMAEARR